MIFIVIQKIINSNDFNGIKRKVVSNYMIWSIIKECLSHNEYWKSLWRNACTHTRMYIHAYIRTYRRAYLHNQQGVYLFSEVLLQLVFNSHVNGLLIVPYFLYAYVSVYFSCTKSVTKSLITFQRIHVCISCG